MQFRDQFLQTDPLQECNLQNHQYAALLPTACAEESHYLGMYIL